MKPLILAAPADSETATGPYLAEHLDAELAEVTVRTFPDGEVYVRIDSDVEGRDVVIVSTLHRPSESLLPVLLLANTARDLKARRVGLVAPYLSYMRQDERFRPGEGVTSIYFAKLLCSAVDWLITVDPHLHRWSSLDEIYTIPSKVVPAAPHIAEWITSNVSDPILVGPDSESEQWVSAVAKAAGAPFVILEKIRHGDRDVNITAPSLAEYGGRQPILIDDIVSTARTMIEAIGLLAKAGLGAPTCIGVHGVFAAGAYEDLLAAGAERVVTANTIAHKSNEIDVRASIVKTLAETLEAL